MQQSLLSKLVQQCAPSVYPLMMQTLLLFLSSTHAGHLIQSYFRRASDRTGSPYGDGHPMPAVLLPDLWSAQLSIKTVQTRANSSADS